MRLLVLGNSDSDGSFMPDPARRWPTLVAAEIERRAGVPVVLDHERFYSHRRAAGTFLDEQLGKSQHPDIIVFSTTTAFFQLAWVANRIEHLFGRRVANWSRRFEDRFGQATGPSSSRARKRLRGVATKFVHGLLGGEAETTYERVVESTVAALQRLAREEAATVVVVGPTHFPIDWKVEEPPGTDRVRTMTDTLAASCRQFRFAFVDRDVLYQRQPDFPGLFVDGVHGGARGHALIAAAVLRELAVHLPADTRGRDTVQVATG